MNRGARPLLGLLLCLFPVTAQLGTAEPWSVDTAERELELWRHEVLLERLAADDVALAPFTTDGCSGGLSAAWTEVAALAPAFARIHGETPPWEHCCVAHDRSYHEGGGDAETPLDSFLARRRADETLRQCVLATRTARATPLAEAYGLTERQAIGLYGFVAELMYRAVRLGGIPCSGLSWRWGYGWPTCDGDASGPPRAATPDTGAAEP